MIEIYRGYIKTIGKKPIETFKDDDSKLVTWETARKYDGFGGVLQENVMFLDIDTQEEKNLLLKILESKNIPVTALETSKGAHFYFEIPNDLKKNSIEWYSPIGIQVTTKLGSKNVCEPLKMNGENRKWLSKSDSLAVLPKWLYPIDKSKNHIPNLSEGGRNQNLFNYILTLQKQGLTKSEIKETITIINKYILEEPLDDDEINTILRDEAFKQQSFYSDKNVFLHHKFSEYLIEEHHIIRIKDELHIYLNGVYSSDQKEIERKMIEEIPILTAQKRNEVLAYLTLKSPNKVDADWRYISFKNGILNVNDWTFVPHDPSYVIRNMIPVDYVPGAECSDVDETLKRIVNGDNKLYLLLEETIGNTFIRNVLYDKMTILTGKRDNGKSTFLKMIQNVLGEENISSLNLKDLNSNFRVAKLENKLANISDEISKDTLDDDSQLKIIVSGQAITIENKGKDPRTMKPYASLIFSANKVPKIKGSLDAMMKRLSILRFTRQFKQTDPDYDVTLYEKLSTSQAKERIVQIGLEGLKRLIENKGFTQVDSVDTELNEFKLDNDSVLAWIAETQTKVINEVNSDVYQKYLLWCYENGVERVSQKSFSGKLCNELNITTKQQRVNGIRKSFYVPKN